MNVKVFEELKLSGNLPTPAGVGMRILQLTRTEDYSAEEMGAAIMSDSSLTGRILRLANSASNAGLEPATTVLEAIMRLGGRTVRDLVLAFSLVSECRAGTCKAFDYDGYWSKSLARAVSAQILSRAIPFGRPEEAYICGLLGEVGRLALASVYSEKYAVLLRQEGMDELQALLTAEQEVFKINHAQVGSCMMNDWGLPEVFAEALEGFCSSRMVPDEGEEIDSLGKVLCCAEVIAEVCTTDDNARASVWAEYGDRLDLLRAHLDMNEEAFVRLGDTCVDEWVMWGESLDISTGQVHKFPVLLGRIEEAKAAIERGVPEDFGGSSPEPRGGMAPVGDKPSEDRYKVLAVDDDPVSLRILVAHLEGEGYEVITADGGKEGLKAALSSAPDLIVTDWKMPDLDGLEFCQSLRKIDAGTNMYFVLLTGHTEESLMVAAFDAGVDDFVTKPFNPKLLSARIKGGIRLARLQRKIEHDKLTMMRQVAELGVLTRKLRSAALTDALTELPNRRYAMKRLESEWASVQRTGRCMSVVMVDIDRFKLVNDTYGHDVGDVVLQETATTIRDAVRVSDEVCRLGGEEFLIVCRNTSETDCMVLSERVREAVEANVVQVASFNKSVTISLGVASTESSHDSITSLLKAADEAVYLAKDCGRNQSRRASEILQRKSA